MVLSFPAITLADSMLWMQWQGLGPDAREVALAPGETAVIEIYFHIGPRSFDLQRLAFGNEPAAALEQMGASALRPGWGDFSMDGPLGGTSQRVDYRELGCDPDECPSAAFDRYGTQTIRLDHVGDGQPVEITFELASIQIWDFSGFPYRYLASSNPDLEDGNRYHIGAGSPGYEDDDGFVDERDPLIVIPVPEPSSLVLLSFATAIIFRRCGHPLRR